MTSALRARHVAAGVNFAGRRAVVVGATSGIGEGCALRLAEAGFAVTAVGRSAERGAAVVEAMKAKGGAAAEHEFVPCDAFSLGEVSRCAKGVLAKHDKVDVLVLTQGMATMQGFTPTVDGNDQKLTLHWWGRAAFIAELLPALRKGATPRVVSVLSGGVHAAYPHLDDLELKQHYTLKNAADAAGYMNDLGLDALARSPENSAIGFVHAAPGFVATRWGTEMPTPVRWLVRGLQVFGKSPLDAAEAMLHPVWLSNEQLRAEYTGGEPGVAVMGAGGQPAARTAAHTPQAREAVWAKTVEVLGRAGVKA